MTDHDAPSRHGQQQPPAPGVPRPLAMLMAVACGLIVANNYYCQPLLPGLERDLGLSSSTVGLCVTLNQAGYALGLMLLVPLGDLLARRGLILVMLCADSIALAAAACAHGPVLLLSALTFVGLTGSAINVLIPMAATLAGDGQRGQVVGTLMTGLLIGVLLARTVSGAVGQAIGWRAVYAGAAVIIAALAVVLRRQLPDPPPAGGSTYRGLLASVARIVGGERSLRRRMAMGAVGFGCFQLCWTALPFLLSSAPYHYAPVQIGAFGLLGAAGALCAQPAGRLHDKGLAHRATGLLILTVVASWATLSGAHHMALLIAGILLLDVSIQGIHVLNQALIYDFAPAMRSRVTTAYMTSYFLGGAIGGGVATGLYSAAGWAGMCAAGGALAVAGLIVWATERPATGRLSASEQGTAADQPAAHQPTADGACAGPSSPQTTA